MPWIEARLRGQRVLARANSDRSLRAEDGRVEIRYRRDDGKAYRAFPRNIEVDAEAPLLDDDACVPAGMSPRSPDSPEGLRRPDSWLAYTDGACSGNPGPAGSGIVIVEPTGKIHEGFEFLGEATNNVAELTAILRAVEWIPKLATSIVVHTDSQYAIGVLQKNWKAKANQELIGRTRQVVKERSAHLVYVPGHKGVPLNERADELAREAIVRRVTRPVAL